jgi:hypothetical protein
VKVNKISLKQEGGQATEQVGAQPQQSVDPAIQQISDFISQAINQGQNAAEVVMSLVQQQVDQQTIGQALMMNGFEEDDIMSLFEQMSQGQQPEEQVGGEPDPANLNQTPEQLTQDERMHADDMSAKETEEAGLSLGKSGIEIKPENEGKFTRWAQARGMSVQEAASKVMANTDEYPPAVVKMANFAKNAAGWNKEYGGENYQMGGVPQGKVAAVNNVSVGNKDMNWQRAPLYINPMEFEYTNDNFSLGKAAAVAYGGYKEFLSGADENKDGIKDGFFRDGSKKSAIRDASKGNYYNYKITQDANDINKQNSMIPTGDNGQPAPSMFNTKPATSMMNAIPSASTNIPQKSFKQWYSSGDAIRNQGKSSDQLKSEYDAYLNNGYMYGGDIMQFGGQLMSKDEWMSENGRGMIGQELIDENDYQTYVSTMEPIPASQTTSIPAFQPIKVERTNNFEGGLNRFIDSPGVQGYGKLSNFAVKGADVINDYFRDKNINQAREDNFNKLGADFQYSTAEDPFNKRGLFDINTGTAGSEGDRTTGLYMSKYGGEKNTVNVDSNLLAKLIAAGADIEIL